MSLARQTRDHVLSIIAASASSEGGLSPAGLLPEESPYTPAVEVAARQIAMRLAHDLRRLKEIKSIDRKIAAKREMLPEYQPWCDGLLAAGRGADGRTLAPTGAEEVLPTVMVWCIDTADWGRALLLAEFVLHYDIALPARYERDAATLVLEEIAEAALKVQDRGEVFPRWVLDTVDNLTTDVDMHDEPRAKLLKAIGRDLAREADLSTGASAVPMIDRAIDALTRAQDLHDRVGVKTLLRGLEKTRTAVTKLNEGDLELPTGVGGSEARPAETSTQPPIGDDVAAKAGTDGTLTAGDQA